MKIVLFINIFVLLVSCGSLAKNNIVHEEFKNEPTSLGDTVQNLGDQIWYVYQDNNNHYWFGSNGQGVYGSDGNTLINFTKNDGLSNDTVRQIQEDTYRNIFFLTMNGINKYDGKQFSTLQSIKSKDWKLEPNDLWFNILGKKDEIGPYRYDGVNLYQLEFPKQYLHDEFYYRGINPFFSPYEVYCIYEDRKGAIWLGTSVFGACRFDGITIKWMYEKDLTETPNGGGFGIRSIFEDQKGSYWICNTLHRYIFDFNKTNNSDRLQYQKAMGIGQANIIGGDENIYFQYILEDDFGNIWLTTWDKGVFKYDGKSIANYSVKEGNKDVDLVSMYKDNQGELWLGTLENGVFKFNGQTFEKFKP